MEMRELILNDINIMRKMEGGFSRELQRWRTFFWADKHISEIDIASLPDEDLLTVFKRIYKRYNQQL